MKIRIEVLEDLGEDEVVIRCKSIDDTVRRIQHAVQTQAAIRPAIAFFKEEQEFYFPLDEVLFFETENELVYAHTANDAYRIKHRLYELEELLPRYFVRAAKATIVNTLQIYSITRDITASSKVCFKNTHKQIYASRHYYKLLRERLNEREMYEK